MAIQYIMSAERRIRKSDYDAFYWKFVNEESLRVYDLLLISLI